MTKELKGDRWTCPNDRNLQLRSKLNAGWSIHTGKKTVKKDPQLTESELIEIQKVLQRSEMLEQNERDRVIKLVDRLENMKRNATQTGCGLSSNRCSLCGDYFCLLRTAPTQCNSCNMILCNKCCIDTECTIDNDLSNNSLQSRRNSSSNLSMTNSFIGQTSGNSKTVYLCRICSEQREFLKKSGVWFLKKFPNYLTNGINTKLKSTSTSNVSQTEKTNISPNEVKHNLFFSPLALKRNISASSTNSTSFRFWNYKENGPNSDIMHNMTDYSADSPKNETLDCEYSKTKPTSRDNSNHKSPISINKNDEVFQFNSGSHHSSKDLQKSHQIFSKNLNCSPMNSPSASTSPAKIFSTASNSSIKLLNEQKNNYFSQNPIRTDISLENKHQSLNQSKISTCKIDNNTSNSGIMNQRSNKDPFLVSDDEPQSPNMTNYNYYSKIIINMNMNSGDKIESSPLSTSFSEEKSMIENFKNFAVSKKESRSKNRSVSSITDEVFNSSLSVSASNLNLESNFDKNRTIQNKCATAKLPRKNRNEEWCSTQLSIDCDKTGDFFDNKNLGSKNIKQLASSCSENTGSSLSINGFRPKISSNIINNLAKKISNQNSSTIDSVAGHSSRGVHSVSSLTTSLAKVNLR